MGNTDRAGSTTALLPIESIGDELNLLIAGDTVFSTERIPSTGTLAIGRGGDSDVAIDHGSISRNHAVLHLGSPMQIEDVGSANGTWIGDTRLEPNVPRELKLAEPIRLGAITVIVQRRPEQVRTRRLRTHEYFESRLEDECARAARTNGSFAVIHLLLDTADPAVHAQVGATLRDGDVVARYAPQELELLMIDTAPGTRELALQRLQRELAAAKIHVRSGAAWFPQNGRDPSALAALARERAHGRLVGDTDTRGVVAADVQMQALHEMVSRVALTDITVLLLGETGVGKEVVAEMLHRRSPRANKPFLRLNCAALTETLLESELFGHERGSFTGAVATKLGLFEAADGGVVFLDEVGELSPSTQAKLLRVLDERMVLRVGGIKPIAIDVRLIAATNRYLERQVARDQFRLDLLYRLNAMSIVIPPLRDRPADIAPLTTAFLRAAAEKLKRQPPILTPAALAALQGYGWPGNIRELRNVIERAVILATGEMIDVGDLPVDKMRSTFMTTLPPRPDSRPAPAGAPDQRQRVIAALEESAGNQTHAARLLGVSRRTLITWIEKYDVPRPRKR